MQSLGKDPDSLSQAEEKDLMTSMVKDLYPGEHPPDTKFTSYSNQMSIPGLEARFKFIVDTMLPITSPDTAAQASVMVKGGFDQCQYEVGSREVV